MTVAVQMAKIAEDHNFQYAMHAIINIEIMLYISQYNALFGEYNYRKI